MFVDLFTNPDRFFRREAEDDDLRRPIVVVAVLGTVSALSGLPSAQATAQAMPAEAQAFAGIAYVGAVVGGFVGAFVAWVVYAGAFHLIATYGFDGEGSFTQTAATTAWGLVPAIIATAISGVLTWYAFQTLAIPTDPTQLQPFLDQVRNNQYLRLSGVLGIVFLLWQAFLWTFGMQHVHRIDLRDAAITVAVPVAIALVRRLYNLV